VKSSYARKLLDENFQEEKERAAVVNFLERDGGFSLNGQSMICLLIVFAIKKGNDFEKIMAKLEEGWEKQWRKQDPYERGNSYAPGKIGNDNFHLFREICLLLNVSDGFY